MKNKKTKLKKNTKLWGANWNFPKLISLHRQLYHSRIELFHSKIKNTNKFRSVINNPTNTSKIFKRISPQFEIHNELSTALRSEFLVADYTLKCKYTHFSCLTVISSSDLKWVVIFFSFSFSMERVEKNFAFLFLFCGLGRDEHLHGIYKAVQGACSGVNRGSHCCSDFALCSFLCCSHPCKVIFFSFCIFLFYIFFFLCIIFGIVVYIGIPLFF